RFSLVEATLAAIRTMYQQSSPPEWFSLLSGVCWPIKPASRIMQDLQQAGADAFMDHQRIDPNCATGNWKQLCVERFLRYPVVSRLHENPRYDCLLKLPPALSKPFLPFSGDLQLYAGSQWFTANARCAERILNWCSSRKYQSLARYCRRIRFADEFFLQTVLANSDGLVLQNDNLRYIDWHTPGVRHPKVLDQEDLAVLRESPAHFARKFLLANDDPMAEFLDQMVFGEQAAQGPRNSNGSLAPVQLVNRESGAPVISAPPAAEPSVSSPEAERSQRKGELSLCIVSKQPAEQAETFIRQLVDDLPFDNRVLYGNPPHTDSRTGFVFDRSLAERAWLKLRRRVATINEEQLQDAAMARHLRRAGVNVMLAQYGTTAVRMMWACQMASIPLVAHFHGNDAYNHAVLAEYRDRYVALFQQAAAIVVVSRAMRQQLISLGAPEQKLVWIPCGVNAVQFSGADPAGAEPHYVAVGRFVEKKAPHLTLLAFAEARRAVPGLRLTMIGDGPLWGACRDLAAQFGVAEAVDFPGAMDHASVCQRMVTARGLVQHSVRASDGDAEGTPVSVTEAQASGLPVIATRHMGIQDVVVDGETGYLVDERDVSAMAERMVQLAREPELAAEMGR
ncbi:MAG: glycosyltransferase, partial [Planctomycetaceae bacterium]|nr:glycosyltransferase [Planctomycetaceae bacterium]